MKMGLVEHQPMTKLLELKGGGRSRPVRYWDSIVPLVFHKNGVH